MTQNDKEMVMLLGIVWAMLIAAGIGALLAMYPLSIIQGSQGFGVLFEGLGGYYWEWNK